MPAAGLPSHDHCFGMDSCSNTPTDKNIINLTKGHYFMSGSLWVSNSISRGGANDNPSAWPCAENYPVSIKGRAMTPTAYSPVNNLAISHQ